MQIINRFINNINHQNSTYTIQNHVSLIILPDNYDIIKTIYQATVQVTQTNTIKDISINYRLV